MKITFLGTGTSQGVPVIGCQCDVCLSDDSRNNRLRTSAHLEIGGKSIVIDTGPDFRQQMLRENITDIDAVIYTHPHKDHIAGMDDIRSFNFMHNKHIPVYLNELTYAQLQKEFDYVFNPNGYGGSPRLDVHIIGKEAFNIDTIQIKPIEVMHDKMSVLGFRIHHLTYITDANYISEHAVDQIKGSKVLVLNALQKHAHPSHFNLEEALVEVQRIQPETAYLTHISHKMGLHENISRTLPPGVFLAYDGLKLEV